MDRRDELWAKVHELSCTHQHIRADECPICREKFAGIIDELCKAMPGGIDNDS